MISFTAKITVRPLSAENLAKQIRFGTALGLTRTAQAAQKEVVKSLGDTFTLRGNWFAQSSKYGIRVKMATKTNLQAEVTTAAPWLPIHEEGGVKTSRSGGRLAIPTENVRRNKRSIIPRAQRPKALRDKRTFIIKTKNGDVLFQRKGRGRNSKIVALYNLEPRARIRKQSTFFTPIRATVARTLDKNIAAAINHAIATAKP